MESEIADSLARLKAFEEGTQIETVKQLQTDREIQESSAATDVSHYSTEIAHKASLVKDDKYIVKVFFVNEYDFPKKYARGDYYTRESGKTERYDEQFASEWDAKISQVLLGENAAKLEPEVIAVTRNAISIRFLVEGSDQLSSIIAGKKVKAIRHVGDDWRDAYPELFSDNISPSNYSDKN